MSRGKSITLTGPAAGAFIRAQLGHRADSEDEQALRVATMVHMEMSKGGSPAAAVALIKALAKDGLEVVAGICTAKKPAAVG